MNNSTVAKIQMLKSSSRCFAFGLIGLLPLIGVPFAVAALWTSGRIRAKEKQFWNAAQPYRTIGVVCAAFGMIFWFLVTALISYSVATSNSG